MKKGDIVMVQVSEETAMELEAKWTAFGLGVEWYQRHEGIIVEVLGDDDGSSCSVADNNGRHRYVLNRDLVLLEAAE